MFQRLKYLIFVLSTTSNIFPYLFLFLLISLVISFGMGAYYVGLFSPSALQAEGINNQIDGAFFDALWWSMKHILDPGALSENYGAPPLVIAFALFNSVMGLIITSALIGYIVNSIQSAVEATRKGTSTIKENGHFLILGWNRKAVPILMHLAKLGEKIRVVILTATDPEVLRNELRRRNRSLNGLKVLPLQGSITSPGELTRIALKKAAYVIVLAEGHGMKNSFSDVTTIKTLMLINSTLNSLEKPNVAAEIVDTDKLKIANLVSEMKHPIVSSGQIISKIMVQCARYPGYSEVYSELFSIEKTIIEILKVEGCEGEIFGDIATRIENGTAIGISWFKGDGTNKRRVTILNPEADFDLAEDDEIVIIRNVDAPLIVNTNQREPSLLGTGIRNNTINPSKRPNIKKILVFSLSPNIGAIIKELNEHTMERLQVVLACKDAGKHCDILASQLLGSRGEAKDIFATQPQLEPMEFDIEGNWSLEGLALSAFDSIFVLADESESRVDADSRTVLLLVLIKDLLKRNMDTLFPPVVAEVLDKETLDLLEGSPINDAVISTEFLSNLLLQVARNPFLESIYRELLNAGGVEMGFRAIDRYVNLNQEIIHNDVVRVAQKLNETVIGYKIFQNSKPRIIMNPNKNDKFSFTNKDYLIVLAQQLYT
jgi:hypothetical protein